MSWQRTGTNNLVRHQNGTYYARTRVNGKQVWRSLQTKTKSVAVQMLRVAMDDLHARRKLVATVDAKSVRGEQCINAFLEATEARSDIGLARKRGLRQGVSRLVATWPEFPRLRVIDIDTDACVRWHEHARRAPPGIGHGHRKQKQEPASPTVTNGAVDALKGVLDQAVKMRLLVRNPAEGIKRIATRRKLVLLPSREQWKEVLAAMRRSGGRSVHAADLCEGLACSGCRLSEAAALRWKHVNFERGMLHVPGTKSETSQRLIVMIGGLKKLLLRMREAQNNPDPEAPIFQVFEAQKSLDAACAAVGVNRMTHHDLRHLFATVSIEGGADNMLLSNWLGHADGGALAMKTYAHLRDEHARAVAARVTFDV